MVLGVENVVSLQRNQVNTSHGEAAGRARPSESVVQGGHGKRGGRPGKTGGRGLKVEGVGEGPGRLPTGAPRITDDGAEPPTPLLHRRRKPRPGAETLGLRPHRGSVAALRRMAE